MVFLNVKFEKTRYYLKPPSKTHLKPHLKPILNPSERGAGGCPPSNVRFFKLGKGFRDFFIRRVPVVGFEKVLFEFR